MRPEVDAVGRYAQVEVERCNWNGVRARMRCDICRVCI